MADVVIRCNKKKITRTTTSTSEESKLTNKKHKMTRKSSDEMLNDMTQFTPTDEQKVFLDLMSAERTPSKSCIVQAFPGTGKSKCLHILAKMRYNKGFGTMLLITFSSDLKDGMRQSVKHDDGKYIVIESVHSLIRNILLPGKDCLTNEHVDEYLLMDKKPPLQAAHLEHISLVAFDEFQDLTNSFYLVFQQLRNMFTPNPMPFVAAGNIFQWIFGGLQNSSVDYVIFPERYFPNDIIECLSFSKTCRLTAEMCHFINTHLDPRKLEMHYPHCWSKYGASIVKYWGNGISSLKCEKCAHVHLEDKPCLGYFNTATIQARKVELVEYNPFVHAVLPSYLDNQIRQKNIYVLVNGCASKKFETYLNAITPFSCKGCEFPETVVTGFDMGLEKMYVSFANTFGQNNTLALEDWPFACYCQMFVSCSRAEFRMTVVKSKRESHFFTKRDVVMDISSFTFGNNVVSTSHRRTPSYNNNYGDEKEGHQQQHVGKNMYDLKKVFTFVPTVRELDEDAFIEKPVPFLSSLSSLPSSSKRTKNNKNNNNNNNMYNNNHNKRLTCIPNAVNGFIDGTRIRHFDRYYRRAVILATYLQLVNDQRIGDWTKFITRNILTRSGLKDTAKPNGTWKAHEDWCKLAVHKCVFLMKSTGLIPERCMKCISLEVEKCTNCLKTFTWMQLAGEIDMTTSNIPKSVIHFSFDPKVKNIANSEALFNFLCYKQSLGRRNLLHNLYIVNPVRETVTQLELKLDPHYYIGELIRRKKWDFLLFPSFSLSTLMSRGIPLTEAQLHRACEEQKNIASLQTHTQSKTKKQTQEDSITSTTNTTTTTTTTKTITTTNIPISTSMVITTVSTKTLEKINATASVTTTMTVREDTSKQKNVTNIA